MTILVHLQVTKWYKDLVPYLIQRYQIEIHSYPITLVIIKKIYM